MEKTEWHQILNIDFFLNVCIMTQNTKFYSKKKTHRFTKKGFKKVRRYTDFEHLSEQRCSITKENLSIQVFFF